MASQKVYPQKVYPQKVYPYEVARIGVIRQRLLTNTQLLQMADSKTPADAVRMLTEAGYGGGTAFNPNDFESILAEELKKAYDLLNELVPEETFFEVFLLKIDYHNAKVVIKESVTSQGGEDYSIAGGSVPVSAVKKAVNEDDYEGLPSELSAAIEEAVTLYKKTSNGQIIDIVLDKAAYAAMHKAAKKTGNEFLCRYVVIMSDLANIKLYLRLKKMGRSLIHFEEAAVPGGVISMETFKEAFENDSLTDALIATPYEVIAKNAANQSFLELEKQCDNFIMDLMKTEKNNVLTMEPLIGYLYAKEQEIRTIRIILTGVLNDIDPGVIKERLRDAYV